MKNKLEKVVFIKEEKYQELKKRLNRKGNWIKYEELVITIDNLIKK